jgi:hypothetical protein
VTLYSVYEPPAEAPDLVDRAEALTFVKEGFAWPALLVPGLWLLYQRMWLELIVFILIFGLLAWAFGSSEEGQALLGWISLALIVLFAFEAHDLRGAALERSGYRLTGVAIGRDLDSAELAFLRTWLPQQQREAGVGKREQEQLRGAKAPVRQTSAAMRGAEGEEVIGLFPRP